MALNVLPGIGDTIGDATILDMREGAAYGSIVMLGLWDNPATPFATWLYNPVQGTLYSGHYFTIRDAAEAEFETR
jgi:hypothetical protein